MEYFKAGKSSHQQRRGRPVVDPNSCPIFRKSAPVSSVSSVGNGPQPTLVQYALKIPKISPTSLGEIPNHVQAPALIVFEDVTKGYEPKSISSIVPCAPSANIFLPFPESSLTRYSVLTN